MLKFKKKYLYLLAAPLALSLISCNSPQDVSSQITVDSNIAGPDSGVFRFIIQPTGLFPAPSVDGSIPTPIAYSLTQIGTPCKIEIVDSNGIRSVTEKVAGETHSSGDISDAFLIAQCAPDNNEGITLTINYTIGTQAYTGSSTFAP